jgi:PKD repeat protein
VEVLNVVPTAVANADDVALVEDDMITLDAYSSSDTPSDLAVLEYAWDFGDGSKGFGIETTHVYSKNGVYQVVLTATDDNGAASTSELTIDVQNAEPYDIRITAEENVNEDELIFFEVAASDTPSDESLLKFAWDFGDGSFGDGYSITHSFTTEGTYTVKITVTDDDGAFKERSVHISVSNPAPVIFGI